MRWRRLVGSPWWWCYLACSGSIPARATASEAGLHHVDRKVGSGMSVIEIAAFIISIALMIFLFYAMLRPEKL